MIDSYWKDALQIIKQQGWKRAQDELKIRLSTNENLELSSLENQLLVLATLQQKFGDLDAAQKILQDLQHSKLETISKDATIRLSKIFSQKGEFLDATSTLNEVLPQKKSIKIDKELEKVSKSTLWRMGFLKGINGLKNDSNYWLDAHKDYAPKHGSQIANNLVFNNLLSIVRDDFEYARIIENNNKSVACYLKDNLSINNVKYLNISKSVVLPLFLDGALLILMRDSFSGILQLLVCRRLLQYEGLSLQAEGISEVSKCLYLLNNSFIEKFFRNFSSEESLFLKWLEDELKDRKLVNYIISERENIFSNFILTRDYNLLSVVDNKSINNNQQRRQKIMEDKVFIVHGHDESNLLRLRNFIKEELGKIPVILKEQPSKGRTIIEHFEEVAKECKHALVLITKDDTIKNSNNEYFQCRPNVLFEIGWFYGQIGRKNVTILYQEGVNIPSDLDGILRIQFNNDITDKFYHLKKELSI